MAPASQLLHCELYWHPQHAFVVIISPKRQYHLKCSPKSVTHMFVWLQRHGWRLQGVKPVPDERCCSCYRFQQQRYSAQDEDNAASEEQQDTPGRIIPFRTRSPRSRHDLGNSLPEITG